MATLHSGSTVFRYKGLKLLGVLNTPELPEGAKAPGVLFLHGFPGAEKNVDVQRRLLVKHRIASFAPHFSGAWGSEGLYRISTLVPQALAALAFLKGRDFVDPERLAVFGFSMGGWTALNAAARRPELRAVAAISPVGGPEMIGPRNREFVERLSRPLRAPRPAVLTADFRGAVASQDPHRAVKSLACPLLLVHGDADETVPCVISKMLHAQAREPKKLVIARGARHDFLDRREWLTRLTADWLAAQLTRP